MAAINKIISIPPGTIEATADRDGAVAQVTFQFHPVRLKPHGNHIVAGHGQSISIPPGTIEATQAVQVDAAIPYFNSTRYD